MKTLIAAFILLASLPLLAEDSPWTTGLTNALILAKKENKSVLMNFTGSDWCEPCEKLQMEVFSKPEFLSYAKTNLVLVEVDFPLKKKLPPGVQDANDALQPIYHVEGYPTLILLKPDGKQIWDHHGRFSGGPPALIKAIEDARRK